MEETVRMVQSAAQAGVEITAELLKILAPAIAKGGMKLLGAGGKLIGFGIDKISDAQAEGTVSRKHLFAEAAKAKTEVKCTDSYPQDIADRLVEKAKENHIPVSLNGEGATRSISYLERDKDVFAQIMQEWQQERLAPKAGQQGIKAFSVSELNVDAVKTHLEQNGVECWFTQSKSGEIHCNFTADNVEKVNTLMTDFKNMRSDIEENCKISTNVPENERQLEIKAQIAELTEKTDSLRLDAQYADVNPETLDGIYSEIEGYEAQLEKLRGEYDTERVKAFAEYESKEIVISDGEKSVALNADSSLRKYEVMAIMREEMGYTPVQAELAANKLADEFGLSENYFAAPTQIENLEKMQVNIRYGSDDATLQDVSFSALKLKDGENVRLNVTNGDNSILIEPAELSDSELKSVFKEQLGMSDRQAEMAVSKVRKIDAQIQSKLRETVYSHDGGQRSVNIERTSQNAFIVKAGETTKSYEFSQINLEEKIAADFGIPAENAHRVVQKAQGQSTIQNKIRANAEKKRTSAKAKNDPFKNQKTGTNSKKVSR